MTDSNLDEILKHIPLADNIFTTLISTWTDRIVEVKTPVYAVPGKFTEDRLHLGAYHQEEGLTYVPFGLAQKRSFPTSHYDYDKSRAWNEIKEKKKKPDQQYLPLELLPFEHDIKIASGRFCPYNVYTLKGLPYKFPFVILEEDGEDGMHLHWLYRMKNYQVRHFRERPEDENKDKWRQYLQDLREGKYVYKQFEDPQDLINKTEQKIIRRKAKTNGISNGTFSKSKDEDPGSEEKHGIDWLDPKTIHAYLDQKIEGQYHAKKTYSASVSEYIAGMKAGDLHLKPVVLFIGPSGVGKTLCARTIAKVVGIPQASTDLQNISGVGYVGQSLSDSFSFIAKNSESEAPYGYFVANEIDKLVNNDISPNNHWGLSVQRELLSVLDNGKIKLWENNDKGTWFDTSNLFYIFTGAFYGLDEIISRRIGSEKKIGFSDISEDPNISDADRSNLLRQTTVEDLIKFGIIPELMGRITVISVFDPLTLEEKISILSKEQMSPISGHITQLRMRGYQVDLQPEALKVIAKACPPETGARAMKNICGKVFTEIEYDPEKYSAVKKIILTSEMVEEILKGECIKR